MIEADRLRRRNDEMESYPRLVVTTDLRDLFGYVEKASRRVAESLDAFIKEHGDDMAQGRPLPAQAREKLVGLTRVCQIISKAAQLLKDEVPDT